MRDELQAAGANVLHFQVDNFEMDAFTYTDSTTMSGIVVNGSHPYLSAITMVAPSPDWFSGVYDLNMVVRRKGKDYYWSDVIYDLYPWDAGTETGNTYRLSNPAEDPHQPIEQLTVDNIPTLSNGDQVLVSPEGSTVLPVLRLSCRNTDVGNTRHPVPYSDECKRGAEPAQRCRRNRECKCVGNVCRKENDFFVGDTRKRCLPCLLETQTCRKNKECCGTLRCLDNVCVQT